MPDQYVVPPPPPDSPLEVVIRTLASDIELLKKNGGNASGFSGPSVTVPRGAVASSGEGNSSSAILWLLVFALGAIILFFIGYYGIPLITGGNATPAGTSEGVPAKGVVAKTGDSGKPAEPTYFGHASFFKTAPDATKDFDPYRTATGPVDHAFIVRTLDSLTGSAGTFTELTTKSSEGRPLLWGELAGLLGAPELDKDIFKNIFVRDFTFFVWRDKAGMWPGFVFKLKDGVSSLLVQKQILGIETPTSNFKGLFLVPVEGPASSFADTQMSGQPTRSLSFAKPKATFIYGWFFKDYMIMSTSEEGLRRAIVSL